tara:strand:+ start:797 stop:1192 length:396 start_codon:yes stop_codon:yes gene_type:complete
MFNIPFKSGGADFTATFISGATQVLAGVSGNIITLTPPAGERVRLDQLFSGGGGTTETGISITVGGVNVVTSLILGSENANVTGLFNVGQGGIKSHGTVSSILGAVNQVIVIIKDTGVTANTVSYGYEFGE